jgi:hypothetical protein
VILILNFIFDHVLRKEEKYTKKTKTTCNGSVIANIIVLIMFISVHVRRPARLTETCSCTVDGKSNAILVQAWRGPVQGFQKVEAPKCKDNQHLKAVRLSALRIGRLYPAGNKAGAHFC